MSIVMKEFITEIQEVVAERTREERIAALVAEGKTRDEAIDAINIEDGVIEFKIDGRVLRANSPDPEQLVFMMAALGRGQTQDARFASMVNLLMETLDENDKDYVESRLLTTDPTKKLRIAQLQQIFEYLMEEWFATSHPMEPSSGSAE